jgi:spermidine/putrescine transport system permease protein
VGAKAGQGGAPSSGGGSGERTSQRRSALRGLFLTLPALVWSVLFFALPFGTMLVWSFFERAGPGSSAASLDNYRRLWEDGAFSGALINSLQMTTAVTVLSVLLAFPLAYAIATQVAQRHQRLCLMLAVLPFWTSYVVRSYAWLLVLAPNGVVNQALLDLGLIAEPLVLSFNAGATLVGFVHFFVMLCTLTIYSSLVRLDPKLLLAAADLGASHWQAFWRVTLPLAAPGVASGAFLTFVITIGDFVTPQILGGSNDLLLPQIVLLQISRRGDIPMAAALSVAIMLCVSVAYLLLARWLTGRRT